MVLPPVFSLGKSNAEDGSVQIADPWINSVNIANFPVGSPIWEAENDYSNQRYRGLVTQNNGVSSIYTQLVGTRTLANAKIWTASDRVLLTVPQSEPATDGFDLGKGTRLTSAGEPYNTARRSFQEDIVLSFENSIDISEFHALREFLRDDCSQGVDDFTITWYDFAEATHRIATVRLFGSAWPLRAVGGVCSFAVRARIVSDGVYT